MFLYCLCKYSAAITNLQQCINVSKNGLCHAFSLVICHLPNYSLMKCYIKNVYAEKNLAFEQLLTVH